MSQCTNKFIKAETLKSKSTQNGLPHSIYYHVVTLDARPSTRVDAKGAVRGLQIADTHTHMQTPLWFYWGIVESWHGCQSNEPISQLEEQKRNDLKSRAKPGHAAIQTQAKRWWRRERGR